MAVCMKLDGSEVQPYEYEYQKCGGAEARCFVSIGTPHQPHCRLYNYNLLTSNPTMSCKSLLLQARSLPAICSSPELFSPSLKADSPSHRFVQSALTMASNLHRNPPFRAEHLGSLLRPDHLLKTRADLDNGKVQQEQLTSIEDASVKDIVETQIKLGFHPISDGEYRRHSTFQTPATLPCISCLC